MLTIALTGNIASGKSTVARVWTEMGARVVESDRLAAEAVAAGTPALARIVDRWGPGILLPDGQLDRAALRDVVFRDAAERRRLEEIVHPEIERLRRAEFAAAEQEGLNMIVADIPLLFEVGRQGDFDVVVLVDAPERVRLERLVADRGLHREEAERMIASQIPAERKRPHADFVIENQGSLEELEAQAREVWQAIRGNAPAAGGGS